MANKEQRELSKPDKLVVLGVAYTLIKSRSTSKGVPFRMRRRLSKMARMIKKDTPTLLGEDRAIYKKLLTMVLKLELNRDNGSIERVEMLLGAFGTSKVLQDLFQECKKAALNEIEEE